MRPELAARLGADSHEVVDRALRVVAVRVGTGYRLNGGAPRRRGGPAPTSADIAAVVKAAGRATSFRAARNQAFFTILAETGARINALRELDGADCVALPSGRLRLFLHEKGKAAPREVELSRDAADALRAYAVAFNVTAARDRWATRVHLGEAGPVWRNSGRGCWPYHDILATLRAACASAGVPAFRPHALRRTFATDSASVVPRHVVMQAGGWQGVERLDDHYVHPRPSTIWQKLAAEAERSGHLKEDANRATDPTPTL
jgi:integrase